MKIRRSLVVVLWAFGAIGSFALTPSQAIAIGSQQNPQTGTFGLEGTIPSPPPTQAATISIPANGQTFTSTPITVSGLCKTGLLIKIFSNNVFAGSTMCANNSYSLKIDLFSGRNDLVARVYDALDQAGPDSNVVTVTFNDAQFAKFGTHVTLTSSYARLGADPGSTLIWPLVISGGTGPYALSLDWGDGTSADLKSVPFPGVIKVDHIYKQSGVYTFIAKVTDSSGTSAYLQLVGVANGAISKSSSSNTQNVIFKTVILWQPLLVVLPLLIISFWLGRRHELYTLRKAIEASRESQ